MLPIIVPERRLFNDQTNEITYVPETKLELEHSLVSLSKWESKWHKPFLGKEEKTAEEIEYYIKCMTLNENVDPNVYICLTNNNIIEINDYIGNPMTATTFGKHEGKPTREIVTSELVYYWMIELNIPFECENWHLNRLLTLIRVCEIKKSPPKKMSQSELANRNRQLNAARRAKMKSKG